LVFKIFKICPHPVTFSLRFFKSDRLLGRSFDLYSSFFNPDNKERLGKAMHFFALPF
jgi:hypothetical protein